MAPETPGVPPHCGPGNEGHGTPKTGSGDGRGRVGQSNVRGGRSQRGGRGKRPTINIGLTSGHSTRNIIQPTPITNPTIPETTEDDNDDMEVEVCFICASPVVYQSVAPCNHITCHICALRMRALYKSKECAHCRTVAPFVIFTDNTTKRFQDYSVGLPDITTTDESIGIRYNNEDIVGDTVLLLRYNCPDIECDFAGLGWPDLHRHVRSVHQKKMCDLCTRNKKVFTHEHELFADKELEKHMRRGDDRPGAVDQTGFKGHPLCAFCGQRFYDGDKLYEHCRNKHERCFLCDREDSRQPHYYIDYNALEQHFKKDHYPCMDTECQEKKFVVFASDMDLKAHQLSEHSSSLSKDVRRDARLVDMAGFNFRPSYEQERRGARGGLRTSGDRASDRRRQGRDPNAAPMTATPAQPLRRDQLAFQRQMAIHSSQSISNRTFGGHLSSSSRTHAPGLAGTSSQSDAGNAGFAIRSSEPISELNGLSLVEPDLTPEERARLMRHAAVIERASNILQHNATKIATFRAKISSFQKSHITPTALVDGFSSLFAETSTTALGILVREVADLFDDKTKAEQLRNAWNDRRAVNDDYPTLPGLSGMRGATTSSSGWAAAAAASSLPTANAVPFQEHTTRVLKLKNSTQHSQRPLPQSRSQASASSSTRFSSGMAAFPPLPSSDIASASRRTTLESSGKPDASATSLIKASNLERRDDKFPALPAAPKPTTTIFGYGTGAVRRDIGGRTTGFSWGSGGAPHNGRNDTSIQVQEDPDGDKGKKKGKQGRKQVLVQWG